MGQLTAEQVAQRAFNLGLLDERQLQEVWASFGSRNVPMADFVQMLVRREFLTNFQVRTPGQRRAFRLLLRRLQSPLFGGQGILRKGLSAVHRETGKVVALKVLRKALQR